MAQFRHSNYFVTLGRLWLAIALLFGAGQALSVPVVAVARPLDPAAVEAWLDGMVPFALKRGEIAGAVVLVVKDGKILLQKGYGASDVAAGKPVDPDATLFRLGSISKLFTWTAVMQQVERGRIDLDADINLYLDFRIKPFAGKAVTMRHLMTHSAGFEEAGKHLIAYDPRDALSLAAYVHAVRPQRIFAPGTVNAYSNYGTALAGYIVQRVSGERYEDYVERHILLPLGMAHTSFRQPLPAGLQALLAKGYAQASGPAKAFETVNAAPAGGGSASAADMARFMIAHLQGGAYGGARILDARTAARMHDTPFTILSPNLHRMEQGFFEMDRNGRHIIGHTGDTAWFHSGLWLWPDDKVGLFLAVNSLGKGSTVSVLRTLLSEQFADRFLPGPWPQGHIDPATARAHAALIAEGGYIGGRRVETSFLSLQELFSQGQVETGGDGTISLPALAYETGTAHRYSEIAPFVWREVDGPSRLAAKVEGGKVVAFSEDHISVGLTQMRPSPWKDARWLLPAFLAALGVLTMNAIGWAVGAGARRHYGRPLTLTGKAAHSFLPMQLLTLGALSLMLAWIWAILNVSSRGHFAALVIDPALIALIALSVLLFPGAAIVSGLHAKRAWSPHSGRLDWIVRGWHLLVVAASLILLWVAIAFHLIGLSLSF